MSQAKPVVKFLGDARFFLYKDIPEQEVASVYALDHPIWGRNLVRTSLVQKKFPDGSFETLNTKYVPEGIDNE